MPSNTETYARKYYEEVVKPKRKLKQQQRQQEVQTTYTGLIKVHRVCPICNKSWEEEIVWNSTHRPSVKKQCPECTLQKRKNYQKTPEYRQKTNARNRKNYAESEELRKRKKESTYRWREKILNVEEETLD